MRFAFDDEQTMLRDMFAAALAREVPPDRLRRWCDSGDFSPFDACVDANGWAGIGTEEAAGGQGGGLLEQALLFEALGHQAAPSGGLYARLAALVLARQAGLAPATLHGLLDHGVQAAFDAGTAIDRHRLTLQATNGVLSGSVSPSLGAVASGQDRATWLLLTPEVNGVALWRVAAAAPGLSIEPRQLLDRTRGLSGLQLQQVAAERLGRLDDDGLAAVNARLAVLLAAESLGLARRMLALTVAYVAQRVQFGVPIGSFQAVKHEAAQILVDLEAAHSGVYYAAWALDEGEADGLLHAWIAKAFTCEAAARTADRALMLHGAIGYTLDHELQFFFKRAKLNVELLGSPRAHRERIAAALPLLP